MPLPENAPYLSELCEPMKNPYLVSVQKWWIGTILLAEGANKA
jgi:hypothetical protein